MQIHNHWRGKSKINIIPNFTHGNSIKISLPIFIFSISVQMQEREEGEGKEGGREGARPLYSLKECYSHGGTLQPQRREMGQGEVSMPGEQ